MIDASASMGFVSRDETLFDRARETARAIAEQGRPGDVFNLVRLSNIPPAVIVPNLAYEPARVVEEIEQMTLPHGTADVFGCLEKIAELLKLAPEVPLKEVFVISDFQRTSWSGGARGADDVARIKALWKQVDAAARVVLIDVGQSDAANVAVTSLESLDSCSLRPPRAGARCGDDDSKFRDGSCVTGRQLELVVDDKLVEQRSVDLTAGAEAVENFSVLLRVRGRTPRADPFAEKDACPLDDERWLVVPGQKIGSVCCV